MDSVYRSKMKARLKNGKKGTMSVRFPKPYSEPYRVQSIENQKLLNDLYRSQKLEDVWYDIELEFERNKIDFHLERLYEIDRREASIFEYTAYLARTQESVTWAYVHELLHAILIWELSCIAEDTSRMAELMNQVWHLSKMLTLSCFESPILTSYDKKQNIEVLNQTKKNNARGWLNIALEIDESKRSINQALRTKTSRANAIYPELLKRCKSEGIDNPPKVGTVRRKLPEL